VSSDLSGFTARKSDSFRNARAVAAYEAPIARFTQEEVA